VGDPRRLPYECQATEEEGAVAGKFELYTDKAGKFRFRLKAGNGEIIAVSEAYGSKASASNGIESVRRNAADAAVDDQTSP
jgi:hypothetical protein